jgi:hypothetical protein
MEFRLETIAGFAGQAVGELISGMATNKPQPTEIREYSSDRERRSITDEFINEQLERRKRQLATPGFRERELAEERARAAKAKQKGTRFPELAQRRSTKPAVVKKSSITGQDEILLYHIL